MRVQALFENGVVRLQVPVEVRHDRFEVVVEIPDEEVIEPSLGHPRGEKIVGEELNAILGALRRDNAPVGVREEKAAWHDHLQRKYLK